MNPDDARLRLRAAAARLEHTGGLGKHPWRNTAIAAGAGVLIGLSPRLQRLLKKGAANLLGTR